MPTAARAIRLAFGFVGRYSGTTGLWLDRCDAMRCNAWDKSTYRPVSCHASAPDKGQISTAGCSGGQPRESEPTAHSPYPGCSGRGAEPALQIPGRHLVGCVDRPHHVMWCVGARCQIKRQCVEACFCHTRVAEIRVSSTACVVRLTESSKVWPWERVRLARLGGQTPRDVFLAICGHDGDCGNYARRLCEVYSETLAGPSL